MNQENLIMVTAAAILQAAHPDDKCDCGTTGNGAKPAAHVWIWRNTEYTAGSTAEFDEKRNLQAAIDYWHTNDPARHLLINKHLKDLFDRAGIDKQLAAAILAHRDGKDVEYRDGSIGHWNRRNTRPGGFYPSFDKGLNWRPAPAPKPKRPHADLIEKRLEATQWFYRLKPTHAWAYTASPAFNPGTEYKQEPLFSEERKAIVRDWLSGTEYQVYKFGKWGTADAPDVMEVPLSSLRKKPTTKKLRTRVAVCDSSHSSFVLTATSDEGAANIEKRRDFLRWMGPWQEVEVDAK